MKILHINTLEHHGGAARATQRLHHALIEKGVSSHLLVQAKTSSDPTVSSLLRLSAQFRAKLRIKFEQLLLRRYPKRQKMLFSSAWIPSNIIAEINKLSPDLVHLHWSNLAMLRIEELPKINVPVIWTFHDNWPLSGGCHVLQGCDRYKQECGACPQLGSNDLDDLSHWIFKRKQTSFANIKSLHLIALSHWMSARIKESPLLKMYPQTILPNLIDTECFTPIDQKKGREQWKLPLNKKLILFGAISATSDSNKGFKELLKALAELNSDLIELVVFGSDAPTDPLPVQHTITYLGHIDDDIKLATLYSSVDLLIVPSHQEAFGQVACEAMSCGTPVVAFAHSGLLDIVDHQTNGYLAKPYETSDLAKGVMWILEQKEPQLLADNARQKIEKQFAKENIVQDYISLYKRVLYNV